ncbi:MAG: HAMP domain-containing protein [Gammaproteobacteria bacterium]|nr:MAG: HAMP domain-containing protein [Gammaproteobacteria bacterium]
MIPPASGWRRKKAGLKGSRLLLPSLGLAAVLLLMAISGLFPWERPALLAFQMTLALAGVGFLLLMLFRIQRYLLDPLAHLRHWALRMSGGNLAARIPPSGKGEFSELARDINALSDSLEMLSQDLDAQVRKQTERLAQKNRSLQILYDVAASINVSRDLNDLLARFLHTLKDMVEAKAATVRLLTEDGRMQLVASLGLSQEVREREKILSAKHCLCGSAIVEGEAVRQQSIRQCHAAMGHPCLPDTDMEMVAIPLQYRGKILGVYNLFGEKGKMTSGEDMKELLTSIGRHLGMAIEKSRLDSETRRLALMQERSRLAHELHDSLAQTLASLRFQVKMLDETLQQDGYTHVAKEVRGIKAGLEQAYRELRELLVHFRAPLDERGLVPALESMVDKFKKNTGISVFFQKACEDVNLPPDMEMQVLRIASEALTNVKKHSQAHTVRLMLRCDKEGRFQLLVEDDGIGIREAKEETEGEHIGHRIMRERARRLGGEIKVESEVGEGTRVLLSFHYPQRAKVA